MKRGSRAVGGKEHRIGFSSQKCGRNGWGLEKGVESNQARLLTCLSRRPQHHAHVRMPGLVPRLVIGRTRHVAGGSAEGLASADV